jgi:hopene-associated glycosyltransferase HpnB
MSLAIVIGAASAIAWLYLLMGRGGFWRAARQRDLARPQTTPRRVVAVIPARNEAPVIARAVRSLLAQQLAGSVHVIVIDDGSIDGTAGIAAQAAADLGATSRLILVKGAALASGWSGKLWAVAQGVAAAEELAPDYLLLTDADIEHDRGNVAQLVAHADAEACDLVSYMVRLSVSDRAERCLIPAFVFFFFMLYPPAWIASERTRTAAAAGGCMLVRPSALARAGGIEAIRRELIDDCALARALKRSGARIWLGLTDTARSVRGYGSWREILGMISRTAFSQLRHSYVLLAATLAGLCLVYVLPPLLLLTASPLPMALGAAAWALMSLAYLPMVRFYRISPLWSVCLPGIACFYAFATAHSAVQYWRGRGGVWKGRVQDARAS